MSGEHLSARIILNSSYTRVIGSLDRVCSSIISAKLIRTKTDTVEHDNLGPRTAGTTTWDSEVVKLENTKE